jgi:hypothetical protein
MGDFLMLGMGSVEMALAWWVSALSVLVCVAWGASHWHSDGEPAEGGERRRRRRPKPARRHAGEAKP